MCNPVSRASNGFGRNFCGSRGCVKRKKLTLEQVRQAQLERQKKEVLCEVYALSVFQVLQVAMGKTLSPDQEERLKKLRAEKRRLGRELKSLKEMRKKRKRENRLRFAA